MGKKGKPKKEPPPPPDAILDAAEAGDDSEVGLLLSKAADPEVRRPAPSSETPLLLATRLGHEAVVRTLVGHNAKLEEKNTTSKTSRFNVKEPWLNPWFTPEESQDMMSRLPERALTVEKRVQDFYQHHQISITDLSQNRPSTWFQKRGWNALLLATSAKQTVVVKALLELNAKVDARGDDGMTSLLLAVELEDTPGVNSAP